MRRVFMHKHKHLSSFIFVSQIGFKKVVGICTYSVRGRHLMISRFLDINRI